MFKRILGWTRGLQSECVQGPFSITSRSFSVKAMLPTHGRCLKRSNPEKTASPAAAGRWHARMVPSCHACCNSVGIPPRQHSHPQGSHVLVESLLSGQSPVPLQTVAQTAYEGCRQSARSAKRSMFKDKRPISGWHWLLGCRAQALGTPQQSPRHLTAACSMCYWLEVNYLSAMPTLTCLKAKHT